MWYTGALWDEAGGCRSADIFVCTVCCVLALCLLLVTHSGLRVSMNA